MSGIVGVAGDIVAVGLHADNVNPIVRMTINKKMIFFMPHLLMRIWSLSS